LSPLSKNDNRFRSAKVKVTQCLIRHMSESGCQGGRDLQCSISSHGTAEMRHLH